MGAGEGSKNGNGAGIAPDFIEKPSTSCDSRDGAVKIPTEGCLWNSSGADLAAQQTARCFSQAGAGQGEIKANRKTTRSDITRI